MPLGTVTINTEGASKARNQFRLTWWLIPPPSAPLADCRAAPDPPAGVFPLDVFHNPGGQASYECNSNLQTALNQTVQTLTCGETGWEGDLLPCDSQYTTCCCPAVL